MMVGLPELIRVGMVFGIEDRCIFAPRTCKRRNTAHNSTALAACSAMLTA